MDDRPVPAAECPYTDLYIYYLRGRPAGEPVSGNGYIGNWQEGDYSFLFFAHKADDRVTGMLESESGLTLLDKYRMSYQDWHGDAPAAFTLGRFLISAPWQPLQRYMVYHLLPSELSPSGTLPQAASSSTSIARISSRIIHPPLFSH